MLQFRYYRAKGYQHFELNGHADDVSALFGFDRVCGMVSVLAQAALYGCKKHAKVYGVAIGNGLLKFKCKTNDEKGIAIMDSCAEGIRQVQAQFSQCFEQNELDISA